MTLEWANGYAFDDLAAVAALWKAHDAGLILGAFSGINERDVATWAAAGKLRVWRTKSGRVVAALAMSEAKHRRSQKDHRGVEVGWIEPGDLCVERMAGDARLLLDGIVTALGDQGRLWLKIWVENPVERWIADRLPVAWYGTKVTAASELVGIWGPAPPPVDPAVERWELDRWGLWMTDIFFDADELAAEVSPATGYADHYASYNRGHSWSALALRGFGGLSTFIEKPAEMSKKWKADHPAALEAECIDTPIYDQFPKIRALMDSIPGWKERVRLMKLNPGRGELTRHADITDPDSGTEDGRLMRLHFPIYTNPRVVFRSWAPLGEQQALHMGPGRCCYLDTRKPHTAINAGRTARVHLVADVMASPLLRASCAAPAAVYGHIAERTPPSSPEAEPWALRRS